MLKTPYRSDAALCFQRLKDIDETYRNTIEQIVKTAKSSIPFREKLESVVNIHIDNVEDPGELKLKKKSWKEEDIYLCCLFDILDALIAEESETILDSSFGSDQKRHAMDRLVKNLKDLPLGGPRWNQNTVPRIQKRLEELKKQIH